MLPLNAPFLPDAAYVRFLSDLGARLHAVHFSLYDPALCDARIRVRARSPQTLAAHLRGLREPKKYLLANGRFQPIDIYQNGDSLKRLIRTMAYLLDAGVLDGLIIADSYLVTALADTAPELVSQLEAVPSINFCIDSMDSLVVLLEMFNDCGFRPPGKISLDRSLNRRPESLEALSRAIRQQWPMMKIELLANEGCLPHCPFRSTHEALIAASNAGMRLDTHRLNRDLACMRGLSRSPHRILASPFIRPEDMSRYAASADLIKVCGRTLGTRFLVRTVGAYAAGRYAGNLLDLLDAAHWMAQRWEIPNHDLPDGFFDSVNSGHPPPIDLKKMFARHARPKPLRIPPMTDM